MNLQSIGMTGIILIDIGIGVVFAILTFSLIATAIQEAAAGMLNWRGKHLEKAVNHLLADPDIGDSVLSHPLINGLKGPRSFIGGLIRGQAFDRMPSSIPKATFATAFVESLIRRRDALVEQVADANHSFEAAVDHINGEIDALNIDHGLKARLKTIVAKGDLARAEIEESLAAHIAQARVAVEGWFDNAMDRVTGWYVRRVKVVLFLIGLVLAGAVNFDLIGYAQELARNDALRNQIVAQAQLVEQTGALRGYAVGGTNARTASDVGEQIDVLVAESRRALDTLQAEFSDRGAPIGWSRLDLGALDLGDFGRMVLSWVIIGLGCTMGGQFWFDLLKRALKVRAGASGLNSDVERVAAQVREIDPAEIAAQVRRELGDRLGGLDAEKLAEIVRREIGRNA